MTLIESILASDALVTILLVIGILVIAAFVVAAIHEARKKADQNEVFDGEEEDDWTPPEPVAYSARVVDMQVVVGNVGGHRRPETDAAFLVTFRTDDGEELEYDIPEELYVTLDIDQVGTLIILNDEFFDFGSGDEYDEAAVEDFEKTFLGGE